MTQRETELYARLFPNTTENGVRATRETLVSLGGADAAAALFDDECGEGALAERCVSLASFPGMLVVRYAAAGVAHRRHDHGPLPPCRKYVYRVGARDGAYALTLMETFDGDEYTRWNFVEDVVRACILITIIVAFIGAAGFLAGYATGTGAVTRIVQRLFWWDVAWMRVTFTAMVFFLKHTLPVLLYDVLSLAWHMVTNIIDAFVLFYLCISGQTYEYYELLFEYVLVSLIG